MNEKIKEIEKIQVELILTINSTFDKIKKMIEESENNTGKYFRKEYTLKYPITYCAGFKGTKPVSVNIGNKEIIAPTWKKVIEEILKEVIKDKNMKQNIMNLRNIMYGRTRTRLSNSKDNMKSPIQIDKNLYIETHYDTSMLIKLLLDILDNIKYNYNEIEIIVKE
ncbi:MAG: hypothetical protein HFE04_02615 [Bacilli bacterium]|nr:hypothetical protein [Bacilli bacterium]